MGRVESESAGADEDDYGAWQQHRRPASCLLCSLRKALPLPTPRGQPNRNNSQGADTVIYERLARDHPTNEALRDVTLSHMEDFGSAGLRTLCLAYRELDPAAYDECAGAALGAGVGGRHHRARASATQSARVLPECLGIALHPCMWRLRKAPRKMTATPQVAGALH